MSLALVVLAKSISSATASFLEQNSNNSNYRESIMAVNLAAPVFLAPIQGAEIRCVESGMRYKGRHDLTLISLAEGSVSAAVFTQNKFRAAPVLVAQEHLEATQPRALLVNAGNANAGTGEAGLARCKESCEAVARELGLKPEQVLPFSTGVIGVQLQMPALTTGIKALGQESSSVSWLEAARAIMTTDTVAKGASVTFDLDGHIVTLTGITKGSGMICPNMATMLAFVVTDADVSLDVLQSSVVRATDASFNRITVDGDTSTNDALVVSSTRQAGNPAIVDANSNGAKAFYAALEQLLIELAHAIVRDGEGATKFVEISVTGGDTDEDCRAVADSIAHSPLVKTALFASDPNWGRLLMAIGKAPAQALDVDRISVSVNKVCLIEAGQPHPEYTEARGKAAFESPEICIEVDLNLGSGSSTVWTSDLSHEYVTINADYRS